MKKAYLIIAGILVVLMVASLVAYSGVKSQSVVPSVEKNGSDPNIILKQVQGIKADYLIQCFDNPEITSDCTAVLKADETILRMFNVPRCAVTENGVSKIVLTKTEGDFIEADGTVVVGKPITLTSECTQVALQKVAIVQRVECNADVDCRTTAVSNTYRTLLGKCVEDVETDPICVYKGLQDAEASAARQRTFVYTSNLIPWYAGAILLGIVLGGIMWFIFRRKRKR